MKRLRPTNVVAHSGLSVLLSLGIVGLIPSAAAQQKVPKIVPLPKDRAVGGKTISKKELKQWLTVLTSPEFGGRGTGQPGFQLAADYVKAHFEKLGLEPAAQGGEFFQAVPWSMTVPDPDAWRLAFRTGDQTAHSLTLTDVHGNLGKSIEVDGPAKLLVVSDLDDSGVEDADVTGAVLFVVIEDESAGPRARIGGIRRVANAARRSGAAAVIIADQKRFAATKTLTGAVTAGRGRAARGRFLRPNDLIIDRATLAAALESLGQDPKKMFASEGVVALGGNVAVRIKTKSVQAPAYNVCAKLPGSDPKLRDEYVVIGCHLDHLGRRGESYSPGADDDGSGTVGLMAIAQAFAKNPVKPRRSVMFLAFCGEEMGLIGSQYFAKNPTIPLESIVAELQIDMIGRDETGQRGNEKPEDNLNCLHLIGTKKLSQDLHDLCMRINDRRGRFALEWDEEGVFYRSDHWSFAKHGVPIAFFFTGFHRDYHRPTDTVEKINFDKLSRIARYVYDLGFELAAQDPRPLVDAEKWDRLRNKGRREPVAPLRGQ